MKIEPFGEFKFNERENEWFGYAVNISPENTVELSLCVDNINEVLNQKIELLKNFSDSYEKIMSTIYEYILKRNLLTRFHKPIEELRAMYFLSGVSLKNDNKTFWVVLEPSNEVETIYNHFLRFTVVNENITWSNLE